MWRIFWPRGRQKPVRRRLTPYHLRLEVLENRCLPSTLTVLNTADSGAGSLRDTMAAAASGDTIRFDPSLAGQTITLTSGQLVINMNLDIEGAGNLTVSGNNASRVFDVTNNAIATIAGLTITAAGGFGPHDGVAPEQRHERRHRIRAGFDLRSSESAPSAR
jgi:hypothetical protein